MGRTKVYANETSRQKAHYWMKKGMTLEEIRVKHPSWFDSFDLDFSIMRIGFKILYKLFDKLAKTPKEFDFRTELLKLRDSGELSMIDNAKKLMGESNV